MTKRTDCHRPGAIIPANYEPVLGYNCATTQDGWPVPSFGIVCELDRRTYNYDGSLLANGAHNTPDQPVCCTTEAHRRAHEAGVAVYGSPGKCGVCGAWYIYGELWLHVPTGEYVHMGHDCASKYELMMDRSAAELANNRARAAVATQIRKAERAEEREAFLAAHPEVADAFTLGDAASDQRARRVIADIAARFVQFCSLSDKQIAYLAKLADEIRNPAPDEVKVDAPTGKAEFTGTIVSAKLVPGYAYETYDWKVTIKVDTGAGIWLAWGTATRALLDVAVKVAEQREHADRDAWAAKMIAAPLATQPWRGVDRESSIKGALRGMRVSVKATLERPRPAELPMDATPEEIARKRQDERSFTFMKRPRITVLDSVPADVPAEDSAPIARAVAS